GGFRGDGDIGAGGEPGAAAEGVAVHARNHGMAALGDGAEHARESHGVPPVLLLAPGCGALHPVEVRAATEGAALAGENNNSNAVIAAHLEEGIEQSADEVLVEGVVHLRPRHRDAGDRALAGLENYFVAHWWTIATH